MIRDELGSSDPGDWAALGERARALERWPQVALAARAHAMQLASTTPTEALEALAEGIEVASAHGLREQAGWAEYGLCETLWVLGDWDAALAAGCRVLDVGERFAYERLTFRTFLVVLQIAAVRRDASLAERWDRWWALAHQHFPPTPSPYGRLNRGAYLVWLAQAAGRPAPLPPPDVVEAIQPMANPHYLGGVETIIRTWLDAGRLDLATAAAGRWAACAEDAAATGLMRASSALVDSWVTGSADSARRAEQLAAAVPAPFWESRARAAAGASD